jgi:hypothetical protein
MNLVLGFQEISQWLAFMTLIVFLTSEVVSHFGPAHGLLLDKTMMRQVSIIMGAMLLVTVTIIIYQTLYP